MCMPSIKEEIVNEWVQLYNNGYLIKNIAKLYDVSRNTVAKKIHPLVQLRSKFTNTYDVLVSKTIKKQNGCIEWIGSFNNQGYGSTTINGIHYLIHRYFYEYKNGPITNGMHCCHICDNRKCVNPDHIFLGTRKDNLVDCAKKGRNNKKLNKDDVLRIRKMAKYKTSTEISIIFSVNESAIRKILKKETWAWL